MQYNAVDGLPACKPELPPITLVDLLDARRRRVARKQCVLALDQLIRQYGTLLELRREYDMAMQLRSTRALCATSTTSCCRVLDTPPPAPHVPSPLRASTPPLPNSWCGIEIEE